jgi:hypothetical protein
MKYLKNYIQFSIFELTKNNPRIKIKLGPDHESCDHGVLSKFLSHFQF